MGNPPQSCLQTPWDLSPPGCRCLRHPVAHSSSTSDTSTVTTDPTRTEQAPGHSLTGRRETQTAERRERKREVEREVQEWASSTACKEQCEKHWRGDAHGVEAMGGEGTTVTLARPHRTCHPRNSRRGPTSLPKHKPCKGTASEGYKGFRATAMAHVNMDNVCPDKGMLCRWSRMLEEPCPSCTRALPCAGATWPW